VQYLQISIRFFTVLTEITGKREQKLQFSEKEKVTLEAVLKALEIQYGKPFMDYIYDSNTGEVKGFLQFLINGKSTSALLGLKSELHEGDMLAIVPPVGGG